MGDQMPANRAISTAIYQEVLQKVEKLLDTLETNSTDYEIAEHQKQGKIKLEPLYHSLQDNKIRLLKKEKGSVPHLEMPNVKYAAAIVFESHKFRGYRVRR